jgi:arsenite oxidase small subunit
VGVGVVCASKAAKAECLQPHEGQARYSPLRVAQVAELKPGDALEFEYPAGHPCLLLRLKEGIAEGVGPNQQFVAYSAICPHRGAVMDKSGFRPEHNALGPCSWHNSAFDLKNGGMPIIGQAARPLIRIILEERRGEIHAVGLSNTPYNLRLPSGGGA